jgi:hypothetical protein
VVKGRKAIRARVRSLGFRNRNFASWQQPTRSRLLRAGILSVSRLAHCRWLGKSRYGWLRVAHPLEHRGPPAHAAHFAFPTFYDPLPFQCCSVHLLHPPAPLPSRFTMSHDGGYPEHRGPPAFTAHFAFPTFYDPLPPQRRSVHLLHPPAPSLSRFMMSHNSGYPEH